MSKETKEKAQENAHEQALQQTNLVLGILDAGYYLYGNKMVNLRDHIDYANKNTLLYTPDILFYLMPNQIGKTNKKENPVHISVTKETSQEVGLRLHKSGKTALLNFASGKHIGGGFLGGAIAQEEDLCRSSSLFKSLSQLHVNQYYEVNNQLKSHLFTDNIIYSKQVPFFRTGFLKEFLPEPFLIDVITSPAPKAVELDKHNIPYKEVLKQRAHYILKVALDNKIDNLILGAWGCGVFKCDPEYVSSVFKELLEKPEFKYGFKQVVFPIYRNQALVTIFTKNLLG